MKRMIALLCIIALLLCGCAVQGEDSAAADDYIQKEEPSAQSGAEKSEATEAPAKEQKPPTTSTEQKQEEPKEEEPKEEDGKAETPAENGIAFAEALSIAQNKARDTNFNKALSAQQREALSLYLATENYLYLQGQNEGHISGFKELGDGQYILQIRIFTTKDAIGKDLSVGFPLKSIDQKAHLSKVDEKVFTRESGERSTYYPRILKKEVQDSSQYIQNLSMDVVVPEGRMDLELSLSDSLNAEETQKLVEHYLSIPEVTWVALSYKTNEKSLNSAIVHRFWETEKEMPIDEALAIVKEKVIYRSSEKLTDRERMAFYVVNSFLVDRAYKDSASLKKSYVEIWLMAVHGYEHLDLQSNLQKFANQKNAELVFENSEFEKENNHWVVIPSEPLSQNDINDYDLCFGYAKNNGAFAKIRLEINQPTGKDRREYMKAILRQYFSNDCASAVSLFFDSPIEEYD